jgi:CDP-diacylglycerol--glycerol-3-phosphate 3-phosphatidyltransferase
MFLLSSNPVIVQTAVVLFFIGGLTDYFDGWYARKYNKVTAFGKFVDPLADKVLTSAAFIGFVVMGVVELWMVMIILLRDILTTMLRVYADSVDKSITTSNSAKWKTFLQMLFIAYILVMIMLCNSGFGLVSKVDAHYYLYSRITYYSMFILTMFSLWTAIEYLVQNRETVSKFLYDNVRKNYL